MTAAAVVFIVAALVYALSRLDQSCRESSDGAHAWVTDTDAATNNWGLRCSECGFRSPGWAVPSIRRRTYPTPGLKKGGAA